ncbi:hypothetical protein EDD15DRAFT_1292065 [Pisolithus albus]|nr:hypothetical protein EDD15DRAFT_1292065 [Pisolithus albus]
MQFALILVSVTLAAVGGVTGLVAVDKRQSPLDVPAACTSTCQSVVDESNIGCPESQCCTNTFITDYYNCLACIGSNIPSFDYGPEQTALNQLWEACEMAGYSLSPPSALPGKTTAKAATTTSKTLATFSTITAPAAAPAPTTTTTVSGNATTSATSGAQSTPTSGAAREAQAHVREILGLSLIWLVHQLL